MWMARPQSDTPLLVIIGKAPNATGYRRRENNSSLRWMHCCQWKGRGKEQQNLLTTPTHGRKAWSARCRRWPEASSLVMLPAVRLCSTASVTCRSGAVFRIPSSLHVTLHTVLLSSSTSSCRLSMCKSSSHPLCRKSQGSLSISLFCFSLRVCILLQIWKQQ